MQDPVPNSGEDAQKQETEQSAQIEPEAASEAVTLTAEQMAEVRKLYETVEAQKAKLEESQDQYLRLLADYDNYRKRCARERETLYTDIKAETIAAFLPIYDNLERALKQPCSDEAYSKGVQMTMSQFDEILKKLGVEEIAALGQPFDPNLHNGVLHEENPELGEGIVSEVLQKGFMLGEKVLRFAMVKVAN
ncbi:MAG: nucleotide exchange factor GrpE [Clostridiales bacterium]|nr:nucleotide exchange factor GrpE [Clostridiales bacterium]